MKKAIVVVSFGTSHLDALKNSIEKIEEKVREEFKEYDVFRAFTAHMIIKKLRERDGLNILKPEESLEKLTQTNIILHESGLFDIYNLNESEANSAIEKIRNIRFVEWVQKSVSNMDTNAPYFGNKPKITYNIYGKIQ